MTFENQIWLILTPLILILFTGLFVFGMRNCKALLRQFAAARLLNQLTEKASHQRTRIKVVLILLAFVLIGFALARPQYGFEVTKRKSRGLDLIFLIDTSRSMLANDLYPSRLARAKLAILDLVDKLESDRVGIVAFAGTAFLQCPPTLDYAAFRETLDALDTNTVPQGGSNIGAAINEGGNAFSESDNYKALILLTDGEDPDGEALKIAKDAAEQNVRVFTIGIGTPEGEYLRIKTKQGQEKYIRNSDGQPVHSKLDENTLRQIASITGGSYERLGGRSLDQFYRSVLATLPRNQRQSEEKEIPLERFQWPLGLALVCLIFELLICRRFTNQAPILILILILSIDPSAAEAEEDSAQALYNQAYDQIQESSYEGALANSKKALESTTDLKLQSDALYNMGHAANQLGEQAFQSQNFEDAVEQWKKAQNYFKGAAELNPEDIEAIEDAESIGQRYKALEAFLEQQKQEQEQSQNSENSEENSKEQEDSGEQGEKSEAQENEQTGEEKGESSQSEDDNESTQSEEQSESSESSTSDSDDQDSLKPDEESEETGPSDKPTDEQAEDGSEEGNTQQTIPKEAIEMTEEEAMNLLKSLQKAKFLPYSESSSGNKKEIQDW